MTKMKKRMHIISEKVDLKKKYNIFDALKILQEFSSKNFVESVDIAIQLGINAKKSEENVQGTIVLPNGTGKKIFVIVFTNKSNIESAKKAGADLIGMEDLAEKIKNENIKKNTVIIASPDAMHIISKLGTILGPKGLMPSIKMGTITQNIYEAVKKAKSGQVQYRNDKNGIIHSPIGKTDFSIIKLQENFRYFIKHLKKIKPVQLKGIYIEKIFLSTTMGIGIPIDLLSIEND